MFIKIGFQLIKDTILSKDTKKAKQLTRAGSDIAKYITFKDHKCIWESQRTPTQECEKDNQYSSLQVLNKCFRREDSKINR